jgi:hypothetical protein
VELTDLPLPPESWAGTLCAAQPPIVVQREHRRDLEKLGFRGHLYAGR